MSSVYSFQVEGISGEHIDLATFEGKKILIVNVASQCGFTPQYAQLQELYETFNDKLVIIGCPSNDFGNQEPGTNEQIKTFCTLNYGVTFPLTKKMSVKGSDMHPLYAWLTQKSRNGVMDSEVRWNFHKYLIHANGSLYQALPSSVSPFDDILMNWLSS